MNTEQMIERIAKNIGATEDALRSRMDEVLSENRISWMDAGKNEEDCTVNALRIAGRQIKSEGERLKRSGATLFEGMFVSVPRYKDWAQLAYKKAANTISGLGREVLDQMVDDGHWTLYEDNNDGTFTKTYNPSLARGEAFQAGTSTGFISISYGITRAQSSLPVTRISSTVNLALKARKTDRLCSWVVRQVLMIYACTTSVSTGLLLRMNHLPL